MSREEKNRKMKEYSLRDKLDKYKSRDEEKCAAYRAELDRDTKQSPVYTAELTAAVKGACN
jgi:hypothetical protein